jgi:hypothetical protein
MLTVSFISLTNGKPWVVLGLLIAVALCINACCVYKPPAKRYISQQKHQYLPPDTPDVPLYNSFWALQQRDITEARKQYTQVILSTIDRNSRRGDGPDLYDISGEPGKYTDIVILDSRPNPYKPDHMVVTYKLVRRNLFFEQASVEGDVSVMQTKDGWKLDEVLVLWEPEGMSGSSNSRVGGAAVGAIVLE